MHRRLLAVVDGLYQVTQLDRSSLRSLLIVNICENRLIICLRFQYAGKPPRCGFNVPHTRIITRTMGSYFRTASATRARNSLIGTFVRPAYSSGIYVGGSMRVPLGTFAACMCPSALFSTIGIALSSSLQSILAGRVALSDASATVARTDAEHVARSCSEVAHHGR
jgi:hypothetical protein